MKRLSKVEGSHKRNLQASVAAACLAALDRIRPSAEEVAEVASQLTAAAAAESQQGVSTSKARRPAAASARPAAGLGFRV